MVGNNHPLPQTASSLGRFWIGKHRRSGAVVLSLGERPSPSVSPPEVYALRQISPPMSSAQRARSFLKKNEPDKDPPTPLGFGGGSQNGVPIPSFDSQGNQDRSKDDPLRPCAVRAFPLSVDFLSTSMMFTREYLNF